MSGNKVTDAGSERETAAAALRDAQAVYQSRPHPKFQQGLAAAAGKVRSAGLGSRKPKRRKQSFASSEPYVKEVFKRLVPIGIAYLRTTMSRLQEHGLAGNMWDERHGISVLEKTHL